MVVLWCFLNGCTLVFLKLLYCLYVYTYLFVLYVIMLFLNNVKMKLFHCHCQYLQVKSQPKINVGARVRLMVRWVSCRWAVLKGWNGNTMMIYYMCVWDQDNGRNKRMWRWTMMWRTRQWHISEKTMEWKESCKCVALSLK